MRFMPLVAGLVLMSVAGRAQSGAPPLPGNVVDVTAGDYFLRAPDTIPAGLTTFRLRVLQGGHAAWIVRVPSGHRASELIAPSAASEPPKWATNLGGPGFPPANGTTSATLVLEPGEYALICYVQKQGAVGHAGSSHAQLGMMHAFVVRASSNASATTRALPTPDVTVTMADHEFRLSAPMHEGRQVVRVVNAGRALHEFKLLRVLPGHTGRESLAWTPETKTPPPDEDAGTAATLSPGGAITMIFDLRAGEYTVFCVPQMSHGMKRIVRVLPRKGVA
jgi:plastocyanin